MTTPVATEPEALTVSALMAERERAARRTKLTTEKPSPGTVDQDEQKTASIALARKSVALQRRTVVSVRLTAEEVEQLRARAEESGVSVSEYMRSCVMDAEKLRTQVRQVITDMRSLGAVSLVRQHNVLQAGDSEMPRNKDWLRTLWRSAGYLLHPFGLLRRSA